MSVQYNNSILWGVKDTYLSRYWHRRLRSSATDKPLILDYTLLPMQSQQFIKGDIVRVSRQEQSVHSRLDRTARHFLC
jgi:hypothetical protein